MGEVGLSWDPFGLVFLQLFDGILKSIDDDFLFLHHQLPLPLLLLVFVAVLDSLDQLPVDQKLEVHEFADHLVPFLEGELLLLGEDGYVVFHLFDYFAYLGVD